MPLSSLTDLELLRALRELRDLVRPSDAAHAPERLTLLTLADAVLAKAGPSPQPAHVSALTAREMFDLIRTHPRCGVEWDDHGDPRVHFAGRVRSVRYDEGAEKCTVWVEDCDVLVYPYNGAKEHVAIAGGVTCVRAADGRVLWQRPPEAPVRCDDPAPAPRTVLSDADLDSPVPLAAQPSGPTADASPEPRDDDAPKATAFDVATRAIAAAIAGSPRIPHTLSLPTELVDRVDKFAAAEGRSRSAMCALFIQRGLADRAG